MPVQQRVPFQQQQQKMVNGPPVGIQQQQARPTGETKPPLFTVLPGSTTAKEGDSVTFTAKATGHPLPQLHWYRSSGAQISTSGRFHVDTFANGSSTLKIDNCTTSEADTYLCVASNEGGAVQAQCSLNILGEKKTIAPKFIGKFQSVTVFEGDSLKLYCKATGDNLRMAWSKDGTPIQTGGIYRVEDKGNGETILHINGAQMADGGWYQCDAINPGGKSSLKGRVVVQSRRKHPSPTPMEQVTLRKVDRRLMREGMRPSEEPRVASKEAPKLVAALSNLNLVEGQTARLECKVSPADDPNLKIAWLLNGKAILASSRVTTVIERGYAVLEISPVTVFDKGEYTIVAVNTLGESRQSVMLDVIG
ncbi:Titin [Toxocara canis]|uniref:Titin n=1 Tax=Toxocara canis TaxID=6265 RepID=A0A0B2VJZ3_TOXCA|nr:Titin [Toxocara canis]